MRWFVAALFAAACLLPPGAGASRQLAAGDLQPVGSLAARLDGEYGSYTAEAGPKGSITGIEVLPVYRGEWGGVIWYTHGTLSCEEACAKKGREAIKTAGDYEPHALCATLGVKPRPGAIYWEGTEHAVEGRASPVCEAVRPRPGAKNPVARDAYGYVCGCTASRSTWMVVTPRGQGKLECPSFAPYASWVCRYRDRRAKKVYLGWQGRGASGNACFVVKDSRAYEAAKYEHLCVANASAGWSTSQRGL